MFFPERNAILLTILTTTPPIQDVVFDSGEAPDSSFSATPLPLDQPPALADEAPGPTESYSRLNEEKAQSVKSLSKSNTNSPRGDLISSLWITHFNCYYCKVTSGHKTKFCFKERIYN